MDVWHVVEGQKVQCSVAGTLECGGGVRGGPAWQTSVVCTLAAKDARDWVSKCRDLAVDGQRCRGRRKKTWMQCVEDDMRRVKLCGDDAQDRVDWRIGIRGNRFTRASTEK